MDEHRDEVREPGVFQEPVTFLFPPRTKLVFRQHPVSTRKIASYLPDLGVESGRCLLGELKRHSVSSLLAARGFVATLQDTDLRGIRGTSRGFAAPCTPGGCETGTVW